jgi:hypothetical protein
MYTFFLLFGIDFSERRDTYAGGMRLATCRIDVTDALS